MRSVWSFLLLLYHFVDILYGLFISNKQTNKQEAVSLFCSTLKCYFLWSGSGIIDPSSHDFLLSLMGEFSILFLLFRKCLQFGSTWNWSQINRVPKYLLSKKIKERSQLWLPRCISLSSNHRTSCSVRWEINCIFCLTSSPLAAVDEAYGYCSTVVL